MKNEFCKLSNTQINALPERFKGFLLSPFQFNVRDQMVAVPEDTFREMIEIIAEYAIKVGAQPSPSTGGEPDEARIREILREQRTYNQFDVDEWPMRFAKKVLEEFAGGEPATDSAMLTELLAIADSIENDGLYNTANAMREILAAREPAPVARELDVDEEAERPAFEAWASKEGYDITRLENGEYSNPITELIFHDWVTDEQDAKIRQATAESAPASAAPGEWISVEDRMPPEGEPVLTYGSKRVQGAVMQYTKLDTWQIETASEWHSAYAPTHWMSLPAAPSNSSPVGAKESK